MIIDGMSLDNIMLHLPKESFIASHIIAPIYTVFPPTTTAATTTFHTALSPLETGWIGWSSYYKEYDRIIVNFLNTDCYTDEKLNSPFPADSLLRYKTIYSYITEHNPDVEYHRVFPPFDPNGVKTFTEMCSRIADISKQSTNRKIISAYWPEPDHTMHYFGVSSDEAHQKLLNIETCLQKMYDEIEDAFIIISADHGLIDIEEIYINDYPELCQMLKRPLSLEARYTTFFIKDEFLDIFPVKFNQIFSSDFKLYTHDEFISSGLLGNGSAHPKVADFIGDYVAISLGRKLIYHEVGQSKHKHFKAEHSGISSTEMVVPLIIAQKDKSL